MKIKELVHLGYELLKAREISARRRYIIEVP
jgi:hypothetical protein